jgi:hypothetical protein
LISNVKNPIFSCGHGHAKPSIQWKFDKKMLALLFFVCWDICFVDSSIMHDECISNFKKKINLTWKQQCLVDVFDNGWMERC